VGPIFFDHQQDLRLPFGKGIECSKIPIRQALWLCGVGDSALLGFPRVLNLRSGIHDGFQYWGFKIEAKNRNSSIIAWIVRIGIIIYSPISSSF